MADEQTLRDAQDLHDRGDHGGAAAICRAILTVTPDDPPTLHLLGVIMSEVGLHSEALPIFELAIAKGGVEPTLLYNYGMTLRSLGNLTYAARAFNLSANNNVGDIESWIALGTTRLALKQFEAAANAFRKAADLDPMRKDVGGNLALAHIGFATERQRARDFNTALASIEAARTAAPNMAEVYSNFGNVLRDVGRFSAAHIAFARARELAPDNEAIAANHALAYLHEGALDAAIETYSHALALAPNNEPIRSSRAQALLMAGRFTEGWAEFEHRLADPAIAVRLAGLPGQPWRGQDVGGRSLLLRCEQGLGDTIQFARYIPILAAKGATIYLAGPARLAHLLSSLPGLAGYMADDGALPVADFYAPLLSLPHLLADPAIPRDTPYLAADPASVARWAERLAPDGRLRIGIAWQGNAAYEMDYLRSVPAEQMAALIEGVDAHFLILQREGAARIVRDAGAETLGPDIDAAHAFADTAAIMANLDLVITSDTAVAHLAGALGVRTWVLLPSAPDWRWRLGRADSDWYPSLRLIRQPAPGDWPGAIALARALLRDGL